MELFNFTIINNIQGWKVVDDGVMGGKFTFDSGGYATFSGNISLKHNGGFSSVRYDFPRKEIQKYTAVVCTVKGKPSRYQLRLKSSKNDAHAYIQHFKTAKYWQSVTLKLGEFYPTYKGKRLDIPSYPGIYLEQIAFLIANKEEENFQLDIRDITFISF